MRIVVCVKHVPDLQAERSFTAGGRVDRSQGDGTLSELDEHAVEAALVLTETLGGEVTVVTVGPADAEDAVRRGLQMGAQHAVHVIDDAIAGSDVFGTALVLAAAIRRLGAGSPRQAPEQSRTPPNRRSPRPPLAPHAGHQSASR